MYSSAAGKLYYFVVNCGSKSLLCTVLPDGVLCYFLLLNVINSHHPTTSLQANLFVASS